MNAVRPLRPALCLMALPPLSLFLCFSSNKPNPNQLSNNVKPALVNGAAGAAAVPGPPGSGQTPGLGRACESCYSKSHVCGCRVTAVVAVEATNS